MIRKPADRIWDGRKFWEAGNVRRSYEMDMCSGPLFRKILVFSLPLMCSGILQLLFNAADIIVVGQFTGSTALAAVGSTTSLINLMVNLFIGLSVGANVVIARSYGAGDEHGGTPGGTYRPFGGGGQRCGADLPLGWPSPGRCWN